MDYFQYFMMGFRLRTKQYKAQRSPDENDNALIKRWFSFREYIHSKRSYVEGRFGAVFDAIDSAVDDVQKELLGDGPMLIGSAGHRATEAARAWLNGNGIDFVFCDIGGGPFSEQVKIDDDWRWVVDGVKLGMFGPSIVESQQYRVAKNFLSSNAPPVLLLPEFGEYVAGFSETKYGIAFGKADVQESEIRPAATAPRGFLQPMIRAVGQGIPQGIYEQNRILDFGCGEGLGVLWLRSEFGARYDMEALGYDPHFPTWSKWPNKAVDAVVMHRVLNTIYDHDQRAEAVKLACSLAPTFIFVAVPTHHRHRQRGSRKYCQQAYGDGRLFCNDFIEGRPEWVFQRGFNESEVDALFAAHGYRCNHSRTEALLDTLINPEIPDGMTFRDEAEVTIYRVYSP